MNTTLRRLIIVLIGIGILYGYYNIGIIWQKSTDEDLKKYCPGWLEDHTKPCGMTNDSPIPTFMALGIVVYFLVIYSEFFVGKELKNGDSKLGI